MDRTQYIHFYFWCVLCVGCGCRKVLGGSASVGLNANTIQQCVIYCYSPIRNSHTHMDMNDPQTGWLSALAFTCVVTTGRDMDFVAFPSLNMWPRTVCAIFSHEHKTRKFKYFSLILFQMNKSPVPDKSSSLKRRSFSSLAHRARSRITTIKWIRNIRRVTFARMPDGWR